MPDRIPKSDRRVTIEQTCAIRSLAALCVIVAALSDVVLAHHPFVADVDQQKPVRLSGTVPRFAWANPHVWIHADVIAGTKTVIDGYRANDGTPVAIAPAYFGVWTLDAHRSRVENANTSADGTRIHRDQRHGLISIVIDVRDASGVAHRQAYVFRTDGKPYATQRNESVENTTFTAIDPFTILFETERNGRFTATGRQIVSPDGQTLTIETCTVGREKPPVSTTVWEKIAS